MNPTKTALRAATLLAAAALLPLAPLACREPAAPTTATARNTIAAIATSVAAASASAPMSAATVPEAGAPRSNVLSRDEWLDRTRPPRQPGEWIGRRPNTPGLEAALFAVLSPPSPEHSQGTIAAVGYPRGKAWIVMAHRADGGPEELEVFDPPPANAEAALLIIDVATGNELRRTPLGALQPRYIATLSDAIVLGTGPEPGGEAPDQIDFSFYDLDARALKFTSSVAFSSDPGEEQEVRAVVGFGDRLVVADGATNLYVRVLDAKGKLLSKSVCPGAPLTPYNATLVRVGDEAFVTNLLIDEDRITPLCAFYLHGPPRTRHVVLPGWQSVWQQGGRMYFKKEEGPARVLLPDLTGGPVEQVPELPEAPSCWGLVGDGTRHQAYSGEDLVVQQVSCCGDSGGGVFICRPPPEASDAGAAAPSSGG